MTLVFSSNSRIGSALTASVAACDADRDRAGRRVSDLKHFFVRATRVSRARPAAVSVLPAAAGWGIAMVDGSMIAARLRCSFRATDRICSHANPVSVAHQDGESAHRTAAGPPIAVADGSETAEPRRFYFRAT